MELKDFFSDHPKVALAFSGGTDSAYLLYAAKKYGADVMPYFVRSQFQPDFELEDASKLCGQLGLELRTVPLDALADAKVAANPEDRCYYCKLNIFGALAKEAESDGYNTIIDGTNASDEVSDRPGMKALRELGVISPLRLCRLSKADIRRLSGEAGLFTWKKPSYACLATRVPEGEPITAGKLKRIEAAEAALARLGYEDLRVRLFNGAARLQFRPGQLETAAARREEIIRALKPYFDIILLDLEGR